MAMVFCRKSHAGSGLKHALTRGTELGLCSAAMVRHSSSASGFTLLEVLLVVSLGIVAAAITLPNLWTMNSTYRLTTATSEVASRVRQARTNALKRNRPSWVVVDGAARTVQVQTAGAGGVAENIGGPQFMPTGVTFGTGAGLATLTFDAMGRPLNAPQTIQLLYPGSGLTRTITVTSTGRVTVN